MEKPIDGNLFVDGRGYISFVNDFDFELENIRRFYVVENHEKGFVRAWHGHKKEEKYVYVVQGCAMVCTIPLDSLVREKDKRLVVDILYEGKDLTKVFLSSKKPQILHIPAGFANGFKTLENNTKIIFFSTSTVEESKGDDYRFDYNIINPWDVEYK